MKCPNCGRITFKGEKNCPRCGAIMPERPTLEEELQMSPRFKRNNATNVRNYGEEKKLENESVFTPTLDFKSADKEDNASTPSSDLGFYGSFGAIVEDTPKPEKSADPELEEFQPVFSTDKAINNLSNDNSFLLEPDNTAENSTIAADISDEAPLIMPSFSIESNLDDDDNDDDDDDLVIPGFVSSQGSYTEKKSMDYEATTKIITAAAPVKKKKPIKEIIPEGIKDMVKAPKVVQPRAVASGTVTKRDDLPKLKEGEMYVALNRRQLRRLTSRSFRGLGVLFTLCMVIISAFCIWTYVNSFADPIVGRWKGNIASQDIPVAELQNLGQERFDSTWEFNDGGSMYLNLIMNETPVSLSGSYEEKSDEKGEQYLMLTLTNPMDGGKYEFSMYYTVTGQVLELNDMEGMGMTITLQKE